MGVGKDMIDMVKSNRKILCKETIENLTKGWPGGFYLVLKRNSMVPSDRPLIAIDYKRTRRSFSRSLLQRTQGEKGSY